MIRFSIMNMLYLTNYNQSILHGEYNKKYFSIREKKQT